MRGFRSKFIFFLIVYFAGFATAIYTLGPMPKGANSAQDSQQGFTLSYFKSQEFAQRLNVGLHKCVDFLKERSIEAGQYIKEKMSDRGEKS
jgi:hypothetical protein